MLFEDTRVCGKISSKLLVFNGVIQCSVLRPLLFLIFENDLPVYIISRCYMLVTDVNQICCKNLVHSLVEDLRQVFIWALV